MQTTKRVVINEQNMTALKQQDKPRHNPDQLGPKSRIDVCREVLERCQYTIHKGVMIDMQSAGVYVAIHDALSDKNKASLERMDTDKAMRVCWNLYTQHGK